MKISTIINDSEVMSKYAKDGHIAVSSLEINLSTGKQLLAEGAIAYLGDNGLLYNQCGSTVLYFFTYEEVSDFTLAELNVHFMPTKITYSLSSTESVVGVFTIKAHSELMAEKEGVEFLIDPLDVSANPPKKERIKMRNIKELEKIFNLKEEGE